LKQEVALKSFINKIMSSFLEKFNDLPKLAKWKALLIENGISLPKADLFFSYPNIDDYKTKYRVVNPKVKDFKFFDHSKDKTIVPAEIIIVDNGKKSLVKVNYKKNSPILMITQGEKVILIEKASKEQIPLEVELVVKRKYSTQRFLEDPDKPLLEDFVQIIGLDRIGILFFDGCWHWSCNKSCLFCDSNPKRKDFKSAMPSLNTLSDFGFNEDKWWDSYRERYVAGIKKAFDYILKNEEIKPHRHLHIMSGNLPHGKKVWEIAFEISEMLNKVEPIANFDSYLNLVLPKDENLLIRAKKLGYKQIQFNLEVVGQDRYSHVCPGKAKVTSYNESVEIAKKAVKIFGFGKVRSNFVLGAQPIEKLLAGVKKLAKLGIVADYSIFVPKRGTPWAEKLAPDMETIINFTKGLAEIYKEHGFESIYCSLSSRSNILYEILNY